MIRQKKIKIFSKLKQWPVCPGCGATSCRPTHQYHGKTEPFLNKIIIHCDACKLHFVFPPPSKKKLEKYNEAYFLKAHGKIISEKSDAHFVRGMAKIRLSYLLRHVEKSFSTIQNVLEIGPGDGAFGELFLERWPQKKYFAIESDLSCHSALKGKGLRLLSSTDPLPKIDLLVLSHVLEHVPQPYKFLEKMVSALKRKRFLFFEVPCHDHLHKSSHEPHLVFFDKPSLKLLLERLALQVIRLSYHGQPLRDLVKPRLTRRLWQKIRNPIVGMGFVTPFAGDEPGLEGLSPQERAVTKPWRAHVELDEPSWWLRAIALKP